MSAQCGGSLGCVGAGLCPARGRPQGSPLRRVTRDFVGRADVGSELSAASGRGSEVSEWPRSKFPASAVRQRGNFGHRNRIIGPYGGEAEIHPLSGGRGRTPPLRMAESRYGGRTGVSAPTKAQQDLRRKSGRMDLIFGGQNFLAVRSQSLTWMPLSVADLVAFCRSFSLFLFSSCTSSSSRFS